MLFQVYVPAASAVPPVDETRQEQEELDPGCRPSKVFAKAYCLKARRDECFDWILSRGEVICTLPAANSP